mgnify:CR=1 FL=1
MPNRAAWAEINLGALRHNYEEIKKNIHGGAKLCAVVKADAYGHGALAVARVAVEAGVSYLAVATLGEAIELRRRASRRQSSSWALCCPMKRVTLSITM